MITFKYNTKKLTKKKPAKKKLIQAWIPEDLHKKFVKKVKKDGISINSLVLESVSQYITN